VGNTEVAFNRCIRKRWREALPIKLSPALDHDFINAVLDQIADGIVACNEDGVLTLFNAAMLKFHGLPQEALPAEEWAQHYDLFHANGRTPMTMEDVPLFRALNGECVKDVEMVIAPKKGERLTLLASGRPLFDSDGSKMGAVVSLHNITERKQAQELLQKSYENLEEKVEVRTAELKESNRQLQGALDEIKTLKGIVPICASCKSIRDDKGFWHEVEAYVSTHTEADFSHGICPDCAKRLYPGIEI
jgi:PAS domain S-box-containing protein